MKIFDTQFEAETYRKSLPGDEEKVRAANRRSCEAHIEKEASFQRCDTDGFLSQWASGITGDLENRKSDLAEHGDHDSFRVLVGVDSGELVSTKLCKLRNTFAGYGHVYKWRVERDNERPEWVTDYKRPQNFEKKGYREAWAVAKAYAHLKGEGTGLSGTCWVATSLDRDAEGITI